jgi:protocatechuate 3,4-dioxygenase beta subunit
MREKDRQIGSLLSRREAMVWLGASGALWLMDARLIGAQSTSGNARSLCIIRPEQTEGPYFIDERLHRMDIRSDPTSGKVTVGTPFAITFQVMHLKAGDCLPLPNAQIDIWHCDASGVYSDVQDPGFDTTGQKFLRGYQLTDAQGAAQFQTIYPGWYPIRTVHIHFKIRTAPISRRSYEFTSQVYFPDDLTDLVHSAAPYASMGPRKVTNHQDFIFRQGGQKLMLQPLRMHDAYTAVFPIALNLP